MKTVLVAAVLTLAASSGAYAGSGSEAAGQKLAQAECDSLWMKASPSGGNLSESAAAAYITDFKAANPDGDTTIEQDEFRNACNQGLIKSSAASGTSEGTSGAGEVGGTSDRTPEKTTAKPLEQKDSVGGETSDRTPEK